MCGRYIFADRTAEEVEIELGLPPGTLSFQNSGDIMPGMEPGILLARNKHVEAVQMRWGFPYERGMIINARSESAAEKMMFRESLQEQRCIIPAAGFYEWDRAKQKVTFYRQDRRPLYLAGLYKRIEERERFVILTVAANASMINVHDRMPLMIEREDALRWLRDTDLAMQYLSRSMPLLEQERPFEQISLF